MNTYADLDVIEVVDGGGSYLTILGIKWANDSTAVIKFNNWMMTFENKDLRFIAHMDRNKGSRYIEPVKHEVVRGWDHAYNISKDYIHPTADGELIWNNAICVSFDSEDAL